MPKPEAFSRVLIDQALKDSGWDLLDDRRVSFELDGQSGRADYVLRGERGPLCVLEAKRPDLDPYDAKEQAHSRLGLEMEHPTRSELPTANCRLSARTIQERGEMGTGARGAPVPEVGL